MRHTRGFALRTVQDRISSALPPYLRATADAMAPHFQQCTRVHGGPGEALLEALDAMPAVASICMVDGTLTPPADTLPEALERLHAVDAPIRVLVPPDEEEGPLSAQGGLAEVDRWVVELPQAHDLLSSESAQTWAGFLDALESLAARPALAAFPTELRSDRHLWLRDGLPLATAAGVPMFPWALFTTDPLDLQRWGVVGKPTFEWLLAHGVDQRAFWTHLLGACPPQTWYTNLAMLNVFAATENRDDPLKNCGELTTAVICHVFYPEMLQEIVDYAANVPSPSRLVVTTDTELKAAELRAGIAADGRFPDAQVRVVSTNRGRDISALLIDCADVLCDPDVDLVVKLHSKKSVQDPPSVSEFFRRHLFQNLVGSPAQAAQIRDLFASEPLLGMVFPPVIHMGLPTMGNGWTLNRVPATEVAPRLGIGADFPFDESTPLSPYGSMFWARRQALVPLVEATFATDEFPDHPDYRDGSLAHVLERLVSYVVFSQGFYARCVQTEDMAAITGLALEDKVDALSARLPAFPDQQVRFLRSARKMAPRQLALSVYQRVQQHSPALARSVMAARSRLKGR